MKAKQRPKGYSTGTTLQTQWTKEIIPIFVEIVRIHELEVGYNYGAIFIGMPDFYASKISLYQMMEEHGQ